MLSRQRIISIVVPVAIFFITLLLINTYQYYRLRSDMASTIISDINESEMERVRFFSSQVNDKLELVKQWGSNGLISFQDTTLLNKKLFPLLEQEVPGTGYILADSKGDEYFLFRNDNAYYTQRYTIKSGKTIVVKHKWKNADTLFSAGNSSETDYDPRTMPWFTPTPDGAVHWAGPGILAHQDVKGISGSVSWSPSKSRNVLAFSITIPLRNIEQLLEYESKSMETYLFLAHAASDFLLIGKNFPSSTDLYAKLQHACARVQPEADNSYPIIRIQANSETWLASMRPVNKQDGRLLIGVLASEKSLLADLRKELLRVDLGDVTFGLAGGVLVFFILRLSVRFNHPSQPGEQGSGEEIIRKILDTGECDTVEFKSTVRMNLKSKKNGKEIELAWLKAVAAFLNSKGGQLLLGVADNGEVIGLEADNFENEDRCQLHVKNLINQHIGSEFSHFLHIRLLIIDNRMIVHIACTPASSPVFVKNGNNEEFYIRTGPSNTKLSPSQTIKYLTSKKS
ncbi:AlbA family DNA-binding domain-containing protein [Desulfogranum japonicum]|uniref:AlbA family DNA-binding domain-containing protein n=1 Tax=Desulfogranum japonicum TaxID=231447 RepID=UPI00042815B4|nr:ATP-binding protein [Desulfogranum japonicum]